MALPLGSIGAAAARGGVSAGAKMALRVVGLRALQKFMEHVMMMVRRETVHNNWYVVSVVRYSVYVEFGTSMMEARPAWRTAIQRFTDEFELRSENHDQYYNALIAGGGALNKKLSLKLKAEIRRQIKSMGAIDTKNYYVSIGFGNSLQEAAMDSYSKLLDPSTAVGTMSFT